MKDFAFEGFDPANTTPVPDVFFDRLLPFLNEAQLKVMLYIIRRTLGFKKTADAISLKQFRYGIVTRKGERLDNGCGLKNMTTISKAAKDLERMGCVEREENFSPEGDQATTVYRVRFRGTTPTVVPPTRNVSPTTPDVEGVLRETYDRTTRNVVPVLRETYSQETVIQQTDLQETVIQEGTYGVDANAHHPHPLFFHPDYRFIAFDNLGLPTTMYLYLQPLPDWENAESVLGYSEQEDKRREWASRDVQAYLVSKNIKVEVVVRREHLGHVIEQNTSIAYSHPDTGNDALQNGDTHVLLPDEHHDPAPVERDHQHAHPQRTTTDTRSGDEPDTATSRSATSEVTDADHSPTLPARADHPTGPHPSSALPDPQRSEMGARTSGRQNVHRARRQSEGETTASSTARTGRGAADSTGIPTDSDGVSKAVEGDSKPARGRRKPTVVDPGTMDRVKHVYAAFDKLAQEVSGDSEFHYDQTKKTTKAITEWLTNKPTEKFLRETYIEMVNTPTDPRTGFSWADNMSIEAVIRQCNKRRLSAGIKSKRLVDNHVVTANTPTTDKKPIYEDTEDYKPNFVLLSRLQPGGASRGNTYASQQH